jgi:hypothetical protein
MIKGFKYIREEYDYRDIVDYDNLTFKRKEPYVHKVLKGKFDHATKGKEPKHRIERRVANLIFFLWIKFIIRDLFAGEKIELHDFITMKLKTMPFTPYYKGFRKDRLRRKKKGFFTVIYVRYKDKFFGKLKYRSYHTWSFGDRYKEQIYKLEDKGIKY